jgi:deoxycytidine triphosphate deaminase
MMAVIPLVARGEGPTVVDTEEAFAAGGGTEGEAILIAPLDLRCLDDTTNSNVSYDLAIGGSYRDHRDNKPEPFPEKTGYSMPAGGAILVVTEEQVHVPRSMYGQIVPKVSLLQKGLSPTTAKVDPGYHGRLVITLFNLGKRPIVLKQNEKFCSLVVFEVKGHARLYSGVPKQLETRDQPSGSFRVIRDKVERNFAVTNVVHMGLTLLISIAALVLSIVLRK